MNFFITMTDTVTPTLLIFPP